MLNESVIVPEAHAEPPPLAAIVTTGAEEIIKFAPLSVPIMFGFELTTLILYPVLSITVKGIVAFIFPLFDVEIKLPIEIGDAKLPVASLNCTL